MWHCDCHLGVCVCVRACVRVGGRACVKERVTEKERKSEIDWLIKLYFSTMKILAQRPTHIYAVATVLLITKTFTVKYYDWRIKTNTVSIIILTIITITHIKRDSDCNGNEKDSEKQLERKSQKLKLKNKQNILGNLQREQGKGRDKIKLKKTTITTKKMNRILNKIKTKQNTTTIMEIN